MSDQIPKMEAPEPYVYIIKRTSDPYEIDSANPPCEGCTLRLVRYVDVRTVDDPQKLNFKIDREEWYLKGENHRVENGRICRDLDWNAVWTREIPDIQEFCEEIQGQIILGKDGIYSKFYSIEIYDDYRE